MLLDARAIDLVGVLICITITRLLLFMIFLLLYRGRYSVSSSTKVDMNRKNYHHLLHFQIEIFSSFLCWIAGLPIFFCDLTCNPTIINFYTPLTALSFGVVRTAGKNSDFPILV
jgi:hypothetical protein